jgi:hypothetical protein
MPASSTLGPLGTPLTTFPPPSEGRPYGFQLKRAQSGLSFPA